MSQLTPEALAGEPPDERLLEMALARPADESARRAASRLLARYQRQVYVWCLRYVGDHERAVEMTQEVLLRAYRKLDSFQGRSRLGSWLFMIARNLCLNELERPALLVDESADPDQMRSRQRDPESELLEKMAEEEVLHLIREHLEIRERRALWLRCFERMPVDTITRVLDIEEQSGARAVLQSARRKLRAALQTRN